MPSRRCRTDFRATVFIAEPQVVSFQASHPATLFFACKGRDSTIREPDTKYETMR